METDACTFGIGSEDNRERDTTADLDDRVTLIDPSSSDLLKRRNFGANRPATLYTTTNQYVPSFPLEQTASRLTCPLEISPALKQGPLLESRMVRARPVAAETNLTPGGHPRSSGRIFSGPSSQTALMACRRTQRSPRGGQRRGCRPRSCGSGSSTCGSKVSSWCGAGARSGALLGLGWADVNTRREERGFEYEEARQGPEVWPCFRVY